MGLDMYASTTKRRLKSSVDFKSGKADEQIHDWRKHPNLHGWMEALYHCLLYTSPSPTRPY